MLINRFILITIFFAASFVSLDAKRLIRNPSIKRCPEKCILAFRCSPYFSEELLWAKVDGTCRVYANGCVKASEACHRQNDCLTPMIDSSKEKCQEYCASGCDAIPESSVCGWFPKPSATGEAQEEMLEFKNQCALDEWSCKNSRPYGYVSPGACQ